VARSDSEAKSESVAAAGPRRVRLQLEFPRRAAGDGKMADSAAFTGVTLAGCASRRLGLEPDHTPMVFIYTDYLHWLIYPQHENHHLLTEGDVSFAKIVTQLVGSCSSVFRGQVSLKNLGRSRCQLMLGGSILPGRYGDRDIGRSRAQQRCPSRDEKQTSLDGFNGTASSRCATAELLIFIQSFLLALQSLAS
jgi:hypothetical protein